LKIVAAMEDLEVTSVKGPILMRKCDHQGENQGFRRQGRKSDKFADRSPRSSRSIRAS